MSQPLDRLLADNLDIWTSATQRKSGAGRGGGKRISLYGIERLRALILDLAVRGKLVPQDAGDEPASELLARSAKAMNASVLLDRFRAPTKILPTKASEAVPSNWVATRLGALVRVINGRAYKKPELLTAGTPVLRVGNLFTSNDWYYSDLDLEDDKYIDDGDLIYAWSASFGPFIWSGGRVIYHYHIWKLEPFSEADVSREFLRLFLAHGTAAIKASGHGIAMLHMTKERMEQFPLPLPPLAEQRRIEAKVDALMALCDALERESAGAMAAHQTLVEELLATLVNSASPADLAANWARLETHFDTLFTTEASIDALKQTILDLAVRGKLVEQDARDAAANELLESWRKAKGEALRSAGDRRIKPSVDAKSPPFPLPSHWAFQSFENVFLFIDYRGNTPPKTADGVPLITAKNIRMGHLDREPREFVSEATFVKWMTRGFPNVGDLFFTTEAPLGNICQNDIEEPFAIAQRVICFQPYGAANTRFLMLAIMSRSMQRIIDDQATGMTAKGIKASKLKPLPLPIPPLAEQQRIVAKVDALMALCDQLKSHLADAAQTRCHLADAITERAAA